MTKPLEKRRDIPAIRGVEQRKGLACRRDDPMTPGTRSDVPRQIGKKRFVQAILSQRFTDAVAHQWVVDRVPASAKHAHAEQDRCHDEHQQEVWDDLAIPQSF